MIKNAVEKVAGVFGDDTLKNVMKILPIARKMHTAVAAVTPFIQSAKTAITGVTAIGSEILDKGLPVLETVRDVAIEIEAMAELIVQIATEGEVAEANRDVDTSIATTIEAAESGNFNLLTTLRNVRGAAIQVTDLVNKAEELWDTIGTTDLSQLKNDPVTFIANLATKVLMQLVGAGSIGPAGEMQSELLPGLMVRGVTQHKALFRPGCCCGTHVRSACRVVLNLTCRAIWVRC